MISPSPPAKRPLEPTEARSGNPADIYPLMKSPPIPGFHSLLPKRWSRRDIYLSCQNFQLKIDVSLHIQAGKISRERRRLLGSKATELRSDTMCFNARVGGIYSICLYSLVRDLECEMKIIKS